MLILGMIKSLKIWRMEFDLPKAAIRSGSIFENGLCCALTLAHERHALPVHEAGIEIALPKVRFSSGSHSNAACDTMRLAAGV